MSHSPSYEFITRELLAWYHFHGREHLPWRKSGITPYHVWMSEVMLQQTQVSRVIDYYDRLLTAFPTVHDLAKATWEEFLPYYQGLGYYSRGRNMLRTAAIIVEKFGGEFPQTIVELRTLPGIGPYTAAAILSFGHGKPHLAFDTNHQRVWGRILHGNKKTAVDPSEIERNLPRSTPFKDFNAGIMDFANLVCTSRSPQCDICPLRSECMYARTRGELEPITSPKKSDFQLAEATTIVILHHEHREYYSENPNAYEPFILPPPLNTRARIKEYFQRKYGLTLSVRPAHWKGERDNTPTQIVNAQILLGTPAFSVYDRKNAQKWDGE